MIIIKDGEKSEGTPLRIAPEEKMTKRGLKNKAFRYFLWTIAGVLLMASLVFATTTIRDSGTSSFDGNLSVDTDTFFVDSTNDRINIKGASTLGALNVNGTVISNVSIATGPDAAFVLYDRVTGVDDQWQWYATGKTMRLWGNGDILTINRSTGNVGIGTASPTSTLHVVGNANVTGNLSANISQARMANFSGSNTILNPPVGGQPAPVQVYYSGSSGNFAALSAVSSGSYRIYATSTYATGYGIRAYAQNVGVWGEGNAVGVLGYGPALAVQAQRWGTDGNTLLVQDQNGNCYHNPGSASEAVSCSSDLRLKKNVIGASSVLDYLNGIPVKNFELKADNGSGKIYTGTIAQELLEIPQYKNLVSKDDKGYYLVQEIPSWKLIKGIQELSKENEMLKSELCKKDKSYSWC